VKLWDAASRTLLDTYEFELDDDGAQEEITCTHWSDDGNYIVCGTESSKLCLFFYENNQIVLCQRFLIPKKSKNSALEQVAYVRFSPDSKMVGVAHMDGRGYIFSLDGERERMQLTMWKPLTGLSAAPTHIQWNERGTWIKYLTRDYDIAHYTLDLERRSTKFVADTPDPDKADWAGDPLIAGWDVQGLYQAGWDGTDLNDASITPDGRFIASGDDFGCVRLHKYPAVNPKAHHLYHGHSSFVVGIEFLRIPGEANRLITCGGADMAIFQWKLNQGPLDEFSEFVPEAAPVDDEFNEPDDPQPEPQLCPEGALKLTERGEE